MSLFPDDDKARKMLPIFDYITRYFPKAHREVTKVCVVNNVRYNPDRKPEDINWARGKSPNQLGSGFRHMLESAVDGKVFEMVPEEIAKLTGIEKVYVLAEAAWRIHAHLELAIEHEELQASHNAVITEALDINKEWTDAPAKPYQPYKIEEEEEPRRGSGAVEEATAGLSEAAARAEKQDAAAKKRQENY